MLKRWGLLVLSILVITNLIIGTNLSHAAPIKPSNEKNPLKIKPKSALLKHADNKVLEVTLNNSYGNKTVIIPYNKLLVNLDLKLGDIQGESQRIITVNVSSKPELGTLYDSLMPSDSKKVIFIYPIFTQAAYSKSGFYDYYTKKCDVKCLTVKIPTTLSGGAYASGGGATMLNLLNYPFVTDIDVDKNPSILKKYDKVILLHNEYVTKKEFDAITTHKNVVYLYPNALYAMVKSDYKTNTITLVKGHAYPDEKIGNGFGWKYDNSKYEYDLQCDNWKFSTIPNGKMLNCYPDYRVFFDQNLLLEIKK